MTSSGLQTWLLPLLLLGLGAVPLVVFGCRCSPLGHLCILYCERRDAQSRNRIVWLNNCLWLAFFWVNGIAVLPPDLYLSRLTFACFPCGSYRCGFPSFLQPVTNLYFPKYSTVRCVMTASFLFIHFSYHSSLLWYQLTLRGDPTTGFFVFQFFFFGSMFRLVASGPVSLSLSVFPAPILGSVCSIWAKFSNGGSYRGRPGERRRWVCPVCASSQVQRSRHQW